MVTSQLETSLKELNTLFFNVSDLVQENVALAAKALLAKDTTLIDTVKSNDKEIDRKEIHIEESCIQIIARYQPKAHTLRYIIALLKVNNDLERISDLAVNMARSITAMSTYAETNMHVLPEMIEKVLLMLSQSIEALIHQDTKMAMHVCKLDDEVDNLKRKQRDDIKKMMIQKPKQAEYFLDIMINGRRLERIADLCTNIAEDVIYITEGEIIRHRKWKSSIKSV